MHVGEPPELLGERRLRRPRRAPERALPSAVRRSLQRAVELLADRARAPRPTSSWSAENAIEHAEQPLDHALVDLAREVDALLQLLGELLVARRDPRVRGERRDLADRPQQVALAVGQRRVARAVGEDHAGPAPAGGDRRAHEQPVAQQRAVALGQLERRGSRATSSTRSSTSACARDRRGLDGEVHAGEGVERQVVRARRAHAPLRLVVAEDAPRAPSTSASTPPRTAGRRTPRTSRPPRRARAGRRTSPARRSGRPERGRRRA